MGRSIVLALCLAVAFALAWQAERLPSPAPASAPASAFAAGRAMADVEVIAKTPHPLGSPANHAVRDHLVQRMTALGLETQVQRADTFRRFEHGKNVFVAGGVVENVIGVLPGRDRTAQAVAIMAHYDSVPGSPGAADDAAGVAAALEVARALKTGGQPARDVILLITDGEESGLLGAQAFFTQHPMAKRIGFLINMEARGGGGRAQMFQTGSENGGTIDLFQRTAVEPAASSLTVFMYEQMPNDTDFSVSKEAGISGLNYAFIGRQFDYHSPTSTPANLDQGSLQHLGVQTLSAAREAAFAQALPGRAPNLVYANTFAGHSLTYPQAMGWAVLALAGVLIAIGAWRAQRAGPLLTLDIAKGVGGALYVICVSAVLLQLARLMTGAEFGFLEQRYLLAQVVRWEIAVALVALGALAMAAAATGRGRMRVGGACLALGAGAACSAFGDVDLVHLALGGVGAAIAMITFGRPASVPGAWLGVLITGMLGALALQILAPTTAFLAAWPLTLAGLGAAATGLAAKRTPAVLIILAALGALGVAWLLSFGHGIFQGLDMVSLLAAIVWLAALLLWPLAQPAEGEKGARMLGLAIILLGLVVVSLVRFDSPWTARHPLAAHVAYYVEPGRALRISGTPELSDWVKGVLTADGGKVEKLRLPAVGGGRFWSAKAAPVEAPPAALTLASQADGSMRLQVVPPPGARSITLVLEPTVKLDGVSLNGRPLKSLEAGRKVSIRWEAAPEGFALSFRAPPGALETSYAAVTEAWPQGAKPLPPRPDWMMGFDDTDSLIAGGTRRFTW